MEKKDRNKNVVVEVVEAPVVEAPVVEAPAIDPTIAALALLENQKTLVQDKLDAREELTASEIKLVETFGLKASSIKFPELYAMKFAERITRSADGAFQFPTADAMIEAFKGTKYSDGEVKKSYVPACKEYKRIIARVLALRA